MKRRELHKLQSPAHQLNLRRRATQRPSRRVVPSPLQTLAFHSSPTADVSRVATTGLTNYGFRLTEDN